MVLPENCDATVCLVNLHWPLDVDTENLKSD
jgi:hypothetical protein